jgi:predicted nucleic acid-binding protein
VYCDTNALVALVVADRTDQRLAVLAAADRLSAQGEAIVVTEAVLVESLWVLMSRYGLSQRHAAASVAELLEAQGVVAWDPDLASESLRLAATHPSLSVVDCLLVVRGQELGAGVLTFDKRLAREVGGS